MNKDTYKINLPEMPQIKDRVTFIYVEHAVINRQDGAIIVLDSRGIIRIPAAIIGILFLGPGTDITHRAVELLGDTGSSMVWVGEHGVRQYASGRPLARSSRYLIRQAEMVSNVRKRIAMARKMYQMRFPDEDVSHLTMQELRAHEGARVRKVYRAMAEKYHIDWDRREYTPDNFSGSDPVNQALSATNVALYGVVYSVISALGLSPGLGFVHTGHDLSFVYDIADLYKAEMTIPLSFEIASKYTKEDDIGKIARQKIRDELVDGKFLSRVVSDLQSLLEISAEDKIEMDTLRLWDDKEGSVPYGINFSEEK